MLKHGPTQDSEPDPAPAGWAGDSLSSSSLRYGGGAMILLGLGIFVAWLAMAPMHAVSSAGACDAAFKDARSRTDTIAAALLSFPDTTGHHLSRRCGETQNVAASAPWR